MPHYVHNIYFIFFSSRRRHTRCSRDWSSDVCSSDLRWGRSSPLRSPTTRRTSSARWPSPRRRSEERRVGKSVDLGGRRIIKKKKKDSRDSPRKVTQSNENVQR